MTGDQLKKLSDLRRELRGSACFAFEKNGTFFLYREVFGASNEKVLHSKDINNFCSRARVAVQVK